MKRGRFVLLILVAVGLVMICFSLGQRGNRPKVKHPSSEGAAAQDHKGVQREEVARELGERTRSPEFRDMVARNAAGQDLTEADWDLFLKIGELNGATIVEPKLTKYLEYPPKTPEGKAMWNWWRAMRKADPRFEYRRPIKFYGKVVDGEGKPLAGVRVGVEIAGLRGQKRISLKSAADGTFSLAGEVGKRITVGVIKEGYGATPEGYQSFNYAEFYEDEFYTPDAANPAIFRLEKLEAK